MGERNALKKAQDYLDFTAFSYTGLIDQLEFEGYTYQEALYGVDNCGADWNEQAAKKAAQYLEFMAFSRQGLIEQLEYEGFTHEQADAVPQPPERCLELCGIAFIISALIGCKTAKRATALTDCGPTYYFMRCGY